MSIFAYAPVLSKICSALAVLHSICLFILRANSKEVDVIFDAIIHLLVDAVAIPVTYFFILLDFQAVGYFVSRFSF